jgi:hypothetical protein
MLRRSLSLLVLVGAITSTNHLFGQVAAPPRVGSQSSEGNSALRANTFEANKPVATPNAIIKPIPLSADAQRAALANIDKNIVEQTESLSDKLTTILPDELAILAKTNGWKAEDQTKLVVALRAGDHTAVYEAWAHGNPQDTAGAEIAGRQTVVKHLMSRLVTDVDKNKAAVRKNVAELDMALGKIASSTPAISDLTPMMKILKTWVEARHLLESAEPEKGAVAKLPGGSVTMVLDPSLPAGTAIVLGKEAMLIGNEGAGPMAIVQGNVAQALKLPIVTGNPLPESQSDEVSLGTLIVNPTSSRATINYNINGNHYVMEPGMRQKLPGDRKWVIEFDKGQAFGPSTYTLSEGTYYFTPSDLGWQLYRQRFDVVMDNSQSNQEFHFLFQGEDMAVPAEATRTISSLYPIVVRFDRGNGSEFVTKEIRTSGNIQIGVNATDNQWDLFPTNDNKRELSNIKPFNAAGSSKR